MCAGVHRYWMGDWLATKEEGMSECSHYQCSETNYLFEWSYGANTETTYLRCSKHSLDHISNGWKAIKAPKCRHPACNQPSRIIWFRGNGEHRATRCGSCGPPKHGIGGSSLPGWNALQFKYANALPATEFKPTRQPRPLP